MDNQIASVLSTISVPVAGIIALLVVARLASEFAAHIKAERRDNACLSLVMAAEQLYGPGKGEAKRRYVREKAKQCWLGDVTREDVEAAVWQLNHIDGETRA